MNLVLVTVDSLRADHLGCYGYGPATSPFLDSLARDGLLFEHAAANSSHLPQSLSALFCGRLPTAGGTIGLHEAHPSDKVPTLAQLLRRAGYATGLVTNQPRIRGRGFTRGFHDVLIASNAKPWSGAEVSRKALEVVEEAGEAPFMVHVHYLDPHEP